MVAPLLLGTAFLLETEIVPLREKTCQKKLIYNLFVDLRIPVEQEGAYDGLG